MSFRKWITKLKSICFRIMSVICLGSRRYENHLFNLVKLEDNISSFTIYFFIETLEKVNLLIIQYKYSIPVSTSSVSLNDRCRSWFSSANNASQRRPLICFMNTNCADFLSRFRALLKSSCTNVGSTSETSNANWKVTIIRNTKYWAQKLAITHPEVLKDKVVSSNELTIT